MTTTDDIDDVLAAADTIDNRLPVEQPRTAWVSFEERLDETMRDKLKMIAYGNEVV